VRSCSKKLPFRQFERDRFIVVDLFFFFDRQPKVEILGWRHSMSTRLGFGGSFGRDPMLEIFVCFELFSTCGWTKVDEDEM